MYFFLRIKLHSILWIFASLRKPWYWRVNTTLIVRRVLGLGSKPLLLCAASSSVFLASHLPLSFLFLALSRLLFSCFLLEFTSFYVIEASAPNWTSAPLWIALFFFESFAWTFVKFFMLEMKEASSMFVYALDYFQFIGPGEFTPSTHSSVSKFRNFSFYSVLFYLLFPFLKKLNFSSLRIL